MPSGRLMRGSVRLGCANDYAVRTETSSFKSVNTMKTAEGRAWAQGVLLALRQNCDLDADTFVFLAGDAYRQNLGPHIKHYAVPREGLAFAKRLQWLERQVT
jgi:hypothetical protein